MIAERSRKKSPPAGKALLKIRRSRGSRASVARLFVSALLFLAAGCAPRLTAPAAKSQAGVYHVVQPGENLYRIGKAYDVSHRELARLNRLRDPHQIRPGQKIFVPGAARTLSAEVVTPGVSSDGGVEASDRRRPRGAGMAAGQGFIWPINGTIHSRFGPRGANFHDGVDIAAPAGTPIHAIDDGEIIYSARLRGYGNMIVIRHDNGFLSVYAHNDRNLASEGQQVRRGEIIARVGSTGRVTGPHLHFEIRRDNKAEDPLLYMPRLCCADAADTLSPGG
jgi:murein DD-endopeptidase MepM/ murein hydrolase activator NlpD